MKESIISKKSFAFAIRVVNVYKYLTEQKKEFILSKQRLRSGTSIGANVEELYKILSPILLSSKQNNS